MRRVIFGNYTENYQPGTGLRSKKHHLPMNILLNNYLVVQSHIGKYANIQLQSCDLGL